MHMSSLTKLQKIQRIQKKGTLPITKTRRRDKKLKRYLHQLIRLKPINKILTEQAKSTWIKIVTIIIDHEYN